MVAATTANPRSELRGLRWADVDFEGLKISLRRGLFRKKKTSMKTESIAQACSATIRAEVKKHIDWHTFRRSLASPLDIRVRT